jgi:uncharacterized protein YecE (DUF72 family)
MAASANLAVDLARLDDFLRALACWRVRHAIELRHRSWFVAQVADRLRSAGVAVCLGDAPDFPMWREVTADFVYVRKLLVPRQAVVGQGPQGHLPR